MFSPCAGGACCADGVGDVVRGVLVPLAGAASPTDARAWLDPGQPPGQRADELLAAMSLDQKLQMVDGTGYSFSVDYAGHIAGIPSLGVPDLYLADGAVGVGNGSTGVTQFPSGLNDAATWDPSLVGQIGAADGGSRRPRVTTCRWRRT